MQATFSYESMEDLKSMHFEQKDVNAWYAVEQLLKHFQQEMCEEIDKESLKKLEAQFADEKKRFYQQVYLCTSITSTTE